ncbi:MAG: protein kinase [Candidatus Promineifilaceae bacterium]
MMSKKRLIGNRYELGRMLGRGGMGTVYYATDTHTGQPVAIKMLAPETIPNNPELVERFEREAEALRALNHPNIVKVLATVEEDDMATGAFAPYLVMEFVPGGSLRELIDQEGQLSIKRTLEIALDVSDALTRAHHLNIVHRDIKPANVLLAEDGTPRLTDFGLARFGDALDGQSPRLTQKGMMMGTVDYLSPEACQGEELDARADIWAFGVMVFEMLAGQRPSTGPSVTAILTAILTQPIPDIEALRPEVPEGLVDLVDRMLAKDREERIPSVRLVGAELEAIIQEVDSALGFSPRSTPVASRFARPTPGPIGATPHNLPAQTTPFIGRQAELTELARLFADPNIRLVSILGPGGMGKTRLALEAAAAQLPSFGQGVYFVPLAQLNSAEDIIPAVAEAVGLQFYEGGTPKQQLLEYFQRKQILLVVDNFEHVLNGAELVSEIMGFAQGVKVLATSREKLNLQVETRFRLEGMDFPEWEAEQEISALDAILEYSAVKLFLQSARRARPGFELRADDLHDVVQICQLVGGMPLGILLAAAWVEMFSPKEIAGEIGQSPDFLAGDLRDVPDRHRSIRAVFDSTWNQLSVAEQKVFMRLSVFRGGFGREAARDVAGADLRALIGLVNKSLLRREPISGRYEIHELLRQYAREHLEAAKTEDKILEAHCTYYTGFLEERLQRMLGPRQVRALDEIEAEFENVRLAWRRAVAYKDYAAIDRASESLFVFSDMRSREYEGEKLLLQAREKLAPQPGEEPHPAWDRVLLPWYDILLQSKGRPEDDDEIKAQAETALVFAQKRDDRLGIAHGLILVAHFAESGEAIQMYKKALILVPRLDDSYWVRIRVGYCYRALGDYQKAIKAFQQSFERGREIGEKEKMGWSLFNIGETEILFGDYSKAEGRWRQANRLFREVGTSVGVAWTNIDLGLIAFHKGDFDVAKSLVEEIKDIATEANRPLSSMKEALVLLGYLALVEGDYQEGQRLFEEIFSVSTTSAEATLGMVFVACGMMDYSLARQRLQGFLESPSPFRTQATANLILPAAVLILFHEGDEEQAVEWLALALHLPTSPQGLLENWQLIVRFQAEAEASLSPEVYAEAWARGQMLNLEEVEEALLAQFQDEYHKPKKAIVSLFRLDQPLVEPLTERELEVLRLIASGLTNKEIAGELIIALGTVKAHTSAIYGKLDVRSRTQAVAKARELKLLTELNSAS